MRWRIIGSGRQHRDGDPELSVWVEIDEHPAARVVLPWHVNPNHFRPGDWRTDEMPKWMAEGMAADIRRHAPQPQVTA